MGNVSIYVIYRVSVGSRKGTMAHNRKERLQGDNHEQNQYNQEEEEDLWKIKTQGDK